MFFERFLPSRYPPLDWIQVEITSHCNAHCIYCPHTVYRENWINQHLPLDFFRRLTPVFSRTGLVHLQGWGEPLLHPDFWEFGRIAKDAGCLVGTTTNAILMSDEMVERMIDEGLDVIGFSLAGVDERNDEIRRGTSLTQVLKWIERIRKTRESQRVHHPSIHIAYMLLRSGLTDLERLSSFLAGTGADQTVISSLSLVVDQTLEQEAMLTSDGQDYANLATRLRAVRADASKLGHDVHFHIASPDQEPFHCSENIAKALVIGPDGRVGPCVFTQMPVQGDNYHYVQGRRIKQENLSFGDVGHESFDRIWGSDDYRTFIQRHQAGDIPEMCRPCLKGHVDTLDS